MMTLYSGTTDPYSHRCRIVLFEKGIDITPWRVFQELGIKSFDLQAFDISIIDDNIRTKNELLIEEYFSLAALVNQWRNIFEV